MFDGHAARRRGTRHGGGGGVRSGRGTKGRLRLPHWSCRRISRADLPTTASRDLSRDSHTPAVEPPAWLNSLVYFVLSREVGEPHEQILQRRAVFAKHVDCDSCYCQTGLAGVLFVFASLSALDCPLVFVALSKGTSDRHVKQDAWLGNKAPRIDVDPWLLPFCSCELGDHLLLQRSETC